MSYSGLADRTAIVIMRQDQSGYDLLIWLGHYLLSKSMYG